MPTRSAAAILEVALALGSYTSASAPAPRTAIRTGVTLMTAAVLDLMQQ